MDGKKCKRCSEYKPWSDYNRCKAAKYGYQTYCRECTKEYRKQYYANNKQAILSMHKDYLKQMDKGVYIVYTTKGRYIGQSEHIQSRIRHHKPWNDRSPVKTKVLKWEVLEYIDSEEERLIRERYYIDKLKPELNTYAGYGEY